MRSGNGRHRRPRQAPALLVTAGVAGAGLALPLLGASAAHAADDGAVWDRVAECESGGLWSVNDQSGYYGGLQITLSMWAEHGGTEYAERPDLASRGQQISVAERILGERGLAAWPSCALRSGLATVLDGLTGQTPDDPSGTEDPSGSTEPSDTPEPEDDPTHDPGDPDPEPAPEEEPPSSRTPSPSPEPSSPDASTGDPAPDGSATPDAPSGRSPEASEPAPGDTGRGEGTGRHRGQPDARERAGQPSDPSRGKRGRTDDAYQVRAGDCLSAIAAEHDVEGGWPALYEANREVVGTDPDLILPGQRLTL